jgi:hypothetical protein
MYLARFSYDLLPADRQKAIDVIRKEIAAAKKEKLAARLLIPLTRGQGAPALQFEVELQSLDQLEEFRSAKDSARSIRELSAVLVAPPTVEILRIED